MAEVLCEVQKMNLEEFKKENKEKIENAANYWRGCSLTSGYSLKLAGFPAINTETGEMVCSSDKEVVEKLKELLDEKAAIIETFSLLENEEIGMGFDVNDQPMSVKSSFRTLTRDNLEALLEKAEKEEKPMPFSWKVGILVFF